MAQSIEHVIKAVAPNANHAFLAASKNAGAIMKEYGITSPSAQAQLIGQMAVECGGFRVFAENLNYSAGRLTQVWPKRFPTLADAEPYAKNPKALANKVYNGRMGNRTGSDDGWNYRGSGGLQHTGASEFARVAKRTGLPVVEQPDMLRQAAAGAAIWRGACSYFVDRGALAAADRGDTQAVCLKINGGYNGLADRKIMVQRAAHALMGGTIVIAEQTTSEEADDAKKKAGQATAGAPAGGAVAGGGTKSVDQSGTGTAAAIGVGLIVFAVIAVVAVIFWRKHFAKQAEIEKTQMQAIDDRINAAPVAAVS